MEFIPNIDTIAEISLFKISDGIVGGYTGTKTDIIIPSSYSLDAEGNVIEGTDIAITGFKTYAFRNNTTLTSVEISEGITSLAPGTFYDCTNLKSVKLPNSLTTISQSAFGNCKALEEISVPANITEIEDYTFSNCINLKSITLPEGLLSIGYSAFNTCSALEYIVIPSTVTSIDEYAFAYCTKLSTVLLFPITVPTISANTFPSLTIIRYYVEDEVYESYKTADVWSDISSQIRKLSEMV